MIMASDVSPLFIAMKMGKVPSFQDINMDQIYDKLGTEEYLL